MATVNNFPLTTIPFADALSAASYTLHKATSTTSLAIGTGAKVFTTQANKAFVAGDYVVAFSDADSANFMHGTVTSYTGTTLTLDITQIGGTGTLDDWTIRTSGPPGEQGDPGASYAATSVTSNAIASSGTKTFTTQAGLAYSAGARVRASDAALPSTNWMEGVVTSYSGTTLAFTADKSAGSGTLTDWTINITGQPGADGAGTGDVVGPAASIDGEIALYDSTTGKLLKRASTTGLLMATSGVIAAAAAGTDYLAPAAIGTTVQGYDADTLKADVDDTLTAGFNVTTVNDGTKTTGTYTPVYTAGNIKRAVNGGAHTLAPQATDGTIIIQYTNDGSAGAITTSGFTDVSGDSFTTTNGHDFMCYLTVVNGFSQLHVVALQ